MNFLSAVDIHKAFSPGTSVLRGVDLDVAEGEIVCLLGPSGCGKTTLLRIVAGLEQADQGVVLLRGQDLGQVPVHKRHFGLMFQEFALFPHKTVGENVAFGLRMMGWSPQKIDTRVKEMLELVALSGYEDRSVFELSGGERQRTALARSLAPEPLLLMLDEPLGSLDRTLREELMNELRMILKRVGVTALYVTHDQQEAFAIADRVVVMNQGLIEQIGRPEQVYNSPQTLFVAHFLGFSNLLPAIVTLDTSPMADTPIGAFRLPHPVQRGMYTLLIRPEAVDLVGYDDSRKAGGRLSGRLVTRSFRGSIYHIALEIVGKDGPHLMRFDIPVRLWRDAGVPVPEVGNSIDLYVDSEQLLLLPPE
jgi:ABC-type Fe3+/spermidine/putrescine transport system ATPase subunit